MMYYIGIDLGTTAVKCALYEDGRKLAEFNREYGLYADGAIAEQDAEDWKKNITDGIREMVEKTGVTDIAGISISSQGITVVPVDQEGKPLSRAISWLDSRAEKELSEVLSEVDAKTLYRITGKPVSSAYSLPKLRWLSKYKKELVDRAYKILLPLDFLNGWLCGSFTTDMSMASGTMLYDTEKREWDKQLLALSGIPEEKLPAVMPMGADLGEIFPSVAEAFGIKPGAHIYLGAQDQKVAALGAGFTPSAATLSLGTASAMIFSADKAKEGSVPRFAFDDKTTVYEAVIGTSGAAVRWLCNTLGFASYREMDEAAEAAGRSGGAGFALGFDSCDGGIRNLSLGTTRGQIAYALYESIAKKIGESFSPDDGIEEIRVFGGGANCALWCSLIAKHTGKTVALLTSNETAVHGAVMLASGGRVPALQIKNKIQNQ